MATAPPRPATDDFLRRYRKRGLEGLPKYAQLREALCAAIHAGHWEKGARLPSDSDLTGFTGDSLGTVQRALRELADAGVVVRNQGSGTYVSYGGGAIDAPTTRASAAARTASPASCSTPKALSRTRAHGSGAWSDRLRPEETTDIVRIHIAS